MSKDRKKYMTQENRVDHFESCRLLSEGGAAKERQHPQMVIKEFSTWSVHDSALKLSDCFIK